MTLQSISTEILSNGVNLSQYQKSRLLHRCLSALDLLNFRIALLLFCPSYSFVTPVPVFKSLEDSWVLYQHANSLLPSSDRSLMGLYWPSHDTYSRPILGPVQDH